MNKKKILLFGILFLLSGLAALPVMAKQEHTTGHTGHSMDMKVVKVDEYMVSYSFMTTAEHHKMMQDMKMDMSKMKMEPNATHHLSLEISDEKSGKKIEDAKVKIKVIDPNEKSQELWVDYSNDMKHYGCDLEMKDKGKYGAIVLFKTSDEKKHMAKFWYDVK